MADRRQVEIFSAGCRLCEDTIRLVGELACDSCDVAVRDMADPEVAIRAARLGVKTVPAVVIDGSVAACCGGTGPEPALLRAAGLGRPLA